MGRARRASNSSTRFGARRTVRSARTRIEKKRRKKIQCEKGDDVVPRGLGPRVAAATRNEGGAAAHPVPTVSFFKDTRGRKTSVKSTFRHEWDEVLPPECSFGTRGGNAAVGRRRTVPYQTRLELFVRGILTEYNTIYLGNIIYLGSQKEWLTGLRGLKRYTAFRGGLSRAPRPRPPRARPYHPFGLNGR